MAARSTTKSAGPTRNVRLAQACAADGRFLYVIAGATGGACNPRLLSAVIKGTEQPSPAVRAGLARALGCTEDDLFEDSVT